MVESVEEYRYLASPGELRDLTINVVSLRINAFRKVYKRANPPQSGGNSPGLGRRLRR